MDVAVTLSGSSATAVCSGRTGAWRDCAATARLWRLVWSLAWMDIRLRYRGSWLGPFWLSLSTAIMVLALGALYPILFRLPAAEYVPYLAVSLILWNTMMQVVNDACVVFVQQEAMILSIRLPLCVHVARILIRNLLALAHHAVVLIPVFIVFGFHPSALFWTVLPALALWIADGFILVLILGALGARFRDIPPIVASVMQLLFFVTPVLWRPAQLGPNTAWLAANPLHAMIDILRAPLLGEHPAAWAWPAALAVSLLAALLGARVFSHVNRRLPFWL